MLVTLSRNLKLRIDSNLTANAKYNLNRLDDLAGTFLPDTLGNVTIRSIVDIQIQPNSADIGGSGSGGVVSIGSTDQPLTILNVYGPAVFSDTLSALGIIGTEGVYVGTAPHRTGLHASASQSGLIDYTLPLTSPTPNQILRANISNPSQLEWASAGAGTVTSVDLAMPDEFQVSGNPITETGVLTVSLASQSANQVWAGPTTGSPDTPAFRSLVAEDIPSISHSGLFDLDNDDHLQYHTDARALSWLGTRSTSDLPEGSNLYYTSGRFNTAFTTKSTSDLVEGSNLYYTDTRWDSRLATKTTANLTEGSNLYYTDARVDTQVATYRAVTDWTSGTTKSFSHNLGSRDVVVQLFDNTTFETIEVDSVVRTDSNTVDLTASSAPSGSGWRILVRK